MNPTRVPRISTSPATLSSAARPMASGSPTLGAAGARQASPSPVRVTATLSGASIPATTGSPSTLLRSFPTAEALTSRMISGNFLKDAVRLENAGEALARSQTLAADMETPAEVRLAETRHWEQEIASITARYEKEIAERDAAVADLRTQIESVVTEAKTSATQKENLLTELSRQHEVVLERLARDHQLQVSELTTAVTELGEQNKRLCNDNDDAIAKLNTEIMRAREKHTSNGLEWEARLAQVQADRLSSVNALQHEHASRLQAMTDAARELREHNACLHAENLQKRGTVDSLASELNSMRDRVAAAAAEKDARVAECVADKMTTTSRLMSEHAEKLAELNVTVRVLRETNACLVAENVEKKNAVAELQADMQRLREELVSMRSDRDAITLAASAERRALTERLTRDHETRVNELMREMRNLEESHAKMSAEVSEKRTSMAELSKEVRTAREFAAAAQTEKEARVAEANARLTSLDRLAVSHESRIAELGAAVRTVGEQNTKLETENQELKPAMARLTLELSNAREQHSAALMQAHSQRAALVERMNRDHETTVLDLEAQLRDARTATANLKEEVARLTHKNELAAAEREASLGQLQAARRELQTAWMQPLVGGVALGALSVAAVGVMRR